MNLAPCGGRATQPREVDLQIELTVHLRVSKIFPDVCKKHLHFLGLPTQVLRKQAEREPLDTFFDLDEVPTTNVFLGGMSALSVPVLSYLHSRTTGK